MSEEIKRLKTEILQYSALQDMMKGVNAIIKKSKGQDCTQTIVDYWNNLGRVASVAQAQAIQQPDYCGRTGYPLFRLTNNNALINNKIKRIQELEKREAYASQGNQEFEFEGGKIVVNQEAERIQVIHDSKPERSVIDNLKSRGYNWSPSNEAWQRMITRDSIYVTNSIFKTEIPQI